MFDIVAWPVLAIVIVLGLGVLYRVAAGWPKEARFGVVTRGALVATLLWLIASGLFAVCTANFASYSKTYGSLASIVVVPALALPQRGCGADRRRDRRREHGLTRARHPALTRRRPRTPSHQHLGAHERRARPLG